MSLIWFWDCVLVLQCEGGRGKESEAAIMAKDDNGEESGICVRGNKEAEPKVELHKKNVWFVFVCVGATKLMKGWTFFSFLFIYFGGWGSRLWLVVVAAMVVVVRGGGRGC